MIINSSVEPHIVDDYEIITVNGIPIVFSIDKEAGDTIDFRNSQVIRVYLAPKPSQTDPDQKTPAEHITIYTAHALSMSCRTRAYVPPSKEQQEAVKKVIHKLHNTVQ